MLSFSPLRFLPAAVALLLAGPASAAGVIGDIRIDGNVAEADFAIKNSSGTVTISFESVTGLTPDSLGLTVEELDAESKNTLRRLMPGISIPMKFPVQIRIDPPADGGLGFTGVVAVEIHTHDLVLTGDSKYRLLSSPHDGIFVDVTESVSAGSIRPKTTKPDFSDFIIGVDKRPLADVIESKFVHLATLLDEHESRMPPELHSELENLCSAAAGAYGSGEIVPAIEYLRALHDRVKSESGTGVPDVWRASGDLVNVAGKLRTAIDTLRYSLTLVANGSALRPEKYGNSGKSGKSQ